MFSKASSSINFFNSRQTDLFSYG